MYNDPKNNHLAKNAQNALQNHLREQEDRKKALKREQDTRELRQLESKLFHKQQEFSRVKSQLDRLKREAVTREVAFKNNIHDHQKEKGLKDLETKLDAIDHSAEIALQNIDREIEQKRQELSRLERQKQETQSQRETQKRSVEASIKTIRSQLASSKQEADGNKRLFDITQKQIAGLEQSVKQFSQESTVLENKIKALKAALR